MYKEPFLAQTNFMGEQITVRGARRLQIEFISDNAGVIKSNLSVMKRPQQGNLYFQFADFISLSRCRLSYNEALKPRIVQ